MEETYRRKELRRLSISRICENGGTTGHYGDDIEAYRKTIKEYWERRNGNKEINGKHH